MRLTFLVITACLGALRGSAQMPSSGPITINDQNGTVIQNLHITSTNGNCVTITNSTNVTIKSSNIGPCGATNGSGVGNGISISGSNGVYVYDNYIHPETMNSGCCDTRDGIFGSGNNQNINIQGNVIAYGETNIEFNGGATSNLNVIGNFLLNPLGPADPRGQNFQCWGTDSANTCSQVTFQNNYLLSSTDTTKYLYPEDQEDSVNFGFANTAMVMGNFITGGHSQSGCGLIADDTANNLSFENNRLLNTGQCGIGIADGTTQIVQSNQVYNTTPVAGGGNTAIYVWKQYSNPCGPTTVANNIADEIQSNGAHSGYWDGGGCNASLSGNTFGTSADPTLTESGTFTPPPIPPAPRNCVVSSPYTDNTTSGLPGCAGGNQPPPNLSISCAPTAGPSQTGTGYSATCTAAGGTNPYTWNISAGALPQGLKLSSATGTSVTISGMPSSSGPYAYTIQVSDSASPAQAVAQTYSGTIAAETSLIPQITSAGAATGTVGSAFNYQITATNSPTSFNATGLPAGLTVATGSGLISGTPTTAGTFSVTLSANNGSGAGSGALTLTVKQRRHK